MSNTAQNLRHPLVSIIIPLYNAEQYIGECLNSIFNQTYKNIDVIVVDDGSTDKSKDIVSSFGSKIKYIYQNYSGGYPSLVRNNGIKHASGDFVTFFDADDIMLPHAINDRVDFLLENPDIEIVLIDWTVFSDDDCIEQSHFMTCPNLKKMLSNKTTHIHHIVLSPPEARHILTTENFVCTNSIFVRRSVLDTAGFFDEDLIIGEDIELIFRLTTKHKVCLLNKIGFLKRFHKNNISNNSPKVTLEKIKTRKKMIQLENDNLIKHRLKKAVSDMYLALCEAYLINNKAEAIKMLIKSFVFKPMRYAQLKKMAKIVLSAMRIYHIKPS